MRRFTPILLIATWTTSLGAEPILDADAILDRALAAAADASSRKLGYQFEHVHRKVRLRGGRAKDETVSRYQVEPRGDEHFYRLVERDGRPATKTDREREARLRGKFRGFFQSDEE